VSVLLLGSLPALADIENPLAPLDTLSPSATFQSFVSEAAKIEKHYADYVADKTAAKVRALLHEVDRIRRLMDLSAVPPATRDKGGGAAAGYLIDILARLPEIPAAEIPGAPGRDWGKLPAKWAIPGTEIHIVRIDDGPRSGEYLFAGESIERLPQFYSLIIGQPPLRPTAFDSWHEEVAHLTGPFFSDRMIRSLPEPLHRIVLGTPVWKVALTLLLALAVFLVTFGWGVVVRRATRSVGHLVKLCLWLTTPLLLAGLVYLVDWFVRTEVNLSGDFASGETVFSMVVLYLAVGWAAWIACFLVAEAIIASPSIPDNSFDAHLLRLLARLGGFFAAGAILVYGANDIGVPALGLVAGLGVGGFALALASQSTVENLFGGFSIFADRPFRVGDFIRYGDSSGSVEAIGARSSRIRAPDGTLATVPNGDLAKIHITNFSRRNKCLFLHTLGLRYETSPAQFGWLLEALRRLLAAHPMVEKSPGFPRVVLTGFGASSIDIELRAYVLTSDYGTFLKIQEDLILDIMRTVEAAGTGFAFPSQTAYLARDDGIDAAAKARIEEEMLGRRVEPESPCHATPQPSSASATGTDKKP
jgi:MscS family membrane protein